MTSGRRSRTHSSPLAAVRHRLDGVQGWRKYVTHLLQDQGAIIVDEQ